MRQGDQPGAALIVNAALPRDPSADLACRARQRLADPGFQPLPFGGGSSAHAPFVVEDGSSPRPHLLGSAVTQSWIVSSSTNSTLAIASQLMPSSSSTKALARRDSRCAADPSRVQPRSGLVAIWGPGKPGRIIDAPESHPSPSSSDSHGFQWSRGICQKLVAILLLLNSRNATETGPELDLRAINRARTRKGDPPLLPLRPVILDITRRLRAARRAGISDAPSDIRAALVRGHFKVRKSGVFWWSPHVRGNVGDISGRDYLVRVRR